MALFYIVAARSIGFGLFEATKRIIKREKHYFNNYFDNETKIHVVSASITAIAKPIFLFPIETMKIVMQVKNETMKESYKDMIGLKTEFKVKSLLYL